MTAAYDDIRQPRPVPNTPRAAGDDRRTADMADGVPLPRAMNGAALVGRSSAARQRRRCTSAATNRRNAKPPLRRVNQAACRRHAPAANGQPLSMARGRARRCFGTGTGLPDVIVAAVMAGARNHRRLDHIRHARNDLRATEPSAQAVRYQG